MTRDISDEHAKYRTALEQIARYKHTPRAYRHQKFEQLVKIAQDALTITDVRNDAA